jgi:signal transduction histidine kinase/ActR/RegA family two-component response regulator
MQENNSDERILIVAPVGQDAVAMAQRLDAHGLSTRICGDLGECCREFDAGAGALLLTQEALELSQLFLLLATLKAQQPWSEIPLIILTTAGAESNLSRLLDLTASAAGSVTVLERPISATTLVRSVEVALRSRRRQYHLRAVLEREKTLRTEAERANRVKDEFLATLSHEVRTPLTAILGWATMMRSHKLDSATVARAIEAIERNAKSQVQLIEDLLDVSRIISGKMQLSIQPISLTPIVKAAIDSVRPAAEAKDIPVEVTIEPGADKLSGDESRLQQVIWNLLSNSIKFTPPGGRVWVNVRRKDGFAEITVRDTGEGIRSEFLPYVFDRFQQADPSITRVHGGLGLGLAITRHLTELHGGTIQADSEGEGRGATFTVTLPITRAQLDEDQSLRLDKNDGDEELANTQDSPNLAGIKVLVIEDDQDSREFLRIVLEGFGADIVTASSAREGLEEIARSHPHVIVSDIGMPHEDGYSFIKKVRRLQPGEGRETPAIALTAYVRGEDQESALNAGYQKFIRKPVDASELGRLIASLAGRSEVSGGRSPQMFGEKVPVGGLRLPPGQINQPS